MSQIMNLCVFPPNADMEHDQSYFNDFKLPMNTLEVVHSNTLDDLVFRTHLKTRIELYFDACNKEF